MAVPHGSQAAFSLDNSSGSPTDLSGYGAEITLSPEIMLHDTTVFGAVAHAKVPGLKDCKFTVTFMNDPTLQTHLINLYVAQTPGVVTTWSFIIGPQGTTSGFRKITGECLLSGFPIDVKVDDIEKIQASFEVTGSLTFTTY